MKRLSFFCICILIATSINAQNAVKKTLGEFKTLKVFDLIHLELIKSDQNKVEITGKNKNDVVINNKNGILKIKMKLEQAFDGKDTNVKLYYTSLDVIDANEGAKISVKDPIEQFEIHLNAQEGANIKATINVTYANIKAVTGGNVLATGTAKQQWVSLFTGGNYNGKKLLTENTEVSINAAGKASVFARKNVIAKVRAGGDITIYGNPENVEKSKLLGGRIRLANN